MKKILISVLIVLLVFLAYFTIVKGVSLGSFQAYGIQGMKQENDKIETKIEEASKLTSTDFPKQMSTLTNSTKELIKAKEDYTDLTTYSSESQIEQANQQEEYEVEFLWKKVGTHATKQGVAIKMDITTAKDSTQSVDGRKLYDLNFTVSGAYIGIALFVSDLENDSDLEFKIESFKMIPGSNGLQGTFTVKNIPIKLNNLSSNAPTTNAAEQNTTNTTNTNTTNTNTTATNTTTNTTNTASPY